MFPYNQWYVAKKDSHAGRKFIQYYAVHFPHQLFMNIRVKDVQVGGEQFIGFSAEITHRNNSLSLSKNGFIACAPDDFKKILMLAKNEPYSVRVFSVQDFDRHGNVLAVLPVPEPVFKSPAGTLDPEWKPSKLMPPGVPDESAKTETDLTEKWRNLSRLWALLFNGGGRLSTAEDFPAGGEVSGKAEDPETIINTPDMYERVAQQMFNPVKPQTKNVNMEAIAEEYFIANDTLPKEISFMKRGINFTVKRIVQTKTGNFFVLEVVTESLAPMWAGGKRENVTTERWTDFIANYDGTNAVHRVIAEELYRDVQIFRDQFVKEWKPRQQSYVDYLEDFKSRAV